MVHYCFIVNLIVLARVPDDDYAHYTDFYVFTVITVSITQLVYYYVPRVSNCIDGLMLRVW